jgi:hypothetical protein
VNTTPISLEIPERHVDHGGLAEDDVDGYGLGQGSITTLDMPSTAKAKARRRREKLDRDLGGFGFRPTAPTDDSKGTPVTYYRDRLNNGDYDAKKQAKQRDKDAASWDTTDKADPPAKHTSRAKHAAK